MGYSILRLLRASLPKADVSTRCVVTVRSAAALAQISKTVQITSHGLETAVLLRQIRILVARMGGTLARQSNPHNENM